MLLPTRRRSYLQAVASSAMIMLAAVFGCASEEPERVQVTGQVLLDGKLLDAGNIRFVPVAHGRSTAATISPDVRFRLVSRLVDKAKHEGLYFGKYHVAVSTAQVVDDETAGWVAPARYASHRTSGIEAVVDEPTNSLAIELFSDADESAK